MLSKTEIRCSCCGGEGRIEIVTDHFDPFSWLGHYQTEKVIDCPECDGDGWIEPEQDDEDQDDDEEVTYAYDEF